MIGLFYRLMHFAYENVYGRQQMLHYPLHRSDEQDLMQGQVHYTEYCLEHLPSVEGCQILDVGCGNGIQTLHIHQNHRPARTYGVDLSPMHIAVARRETANRELTNVSFAVDDAQRLATVGDGIFDIVICTESAHHYRDKDAFLSQVRRVLKPGGHLLVADLLRRSEQAPGWFDRRLSLFYWSQDKYNAAFRRLGLELIVREDLTKQLLSGFETSSSWFKHPGTKRRASYHLGRLIGVALVHLYTHELQSRFDYHLMVARKL